MSDRDMRDRLWSPWAVLLAGPLVGMVYFWLVYLLAEVACAEGLELVGTDRPARHHRRRCGGRGGGAGAVLAARPPAGDG